MNLIDFNKNFSGFNKYEDIIIDTNILFALLNEFDTWHVTVKKLFDDYIFNEDSNVTLYIHSGIINEVMYLSLDSLRDYIYKHPLENISPSIIENTKKAIQQGTKDFIDFDFLNLISGNKPSVLRQVDYSEYFGAMDSLVVSLVEEYGVSLLTVDFNLKNNIANKVNEFKNIQNVYYTAPRNKTF